MSIDIVCVKNYLNQYNPFNSKARAFVNYLKSDISYDHAVEPITNLQTYFKQKIDALKYNFDAYDYAPSRDLAGLNEKEYETLQKYAENIVTCYLHPNDDILDRPARQRAMLLLEFFKRQGKARMNLINAQKNSRQVPNIHIIGFPDVPVHYITNEELAPDELGQIEEMAILPGRA